MKLIKIKIRLFSRSNDGTRCPNCGGMNLTQVSDHSTNGVNGYICNDCKTEFGN